MRAKQCREEWNMPSKRPLLKAKAFEVILKFYPLKDWVTLPAYIQYLIPPVEAATMSRGRQANHRKFPSSAIIMCQDRPEFMYSFETLRENWTQACSKYGREYHLRLRYYFKSFLWSPTASITLLADFSSRTKWRGLCMWKVADNFRTSLLQIKVPRESPCAMRIFNSEITNQLRHKSKLVPIALFPSFWGRSALGTRLTQNQRHLSAKTR